MLETSQVHGLHGLHSKNSKMLVGIDYCLKGNVHCLSLDNAKVEYCAR